MRVVSVAAVLGYTEFKFAHFRTNPSYRDGLATQVAQSRRGLI